MNIEISCGAVVFTKINGEIKYLLIQNLEGIYGFPKGHVEKEEKEKETALREIYEETINLFQFPSSKRILKEANDFLLK